MSDEWVMVPRKLAESQRNAMAMTHRHDYGIREEWERENIRKHMDQLHRAMLDAAPKPQEQAEPVAQIGWADEFGNLFPMGAWKPTQRTYHDSHKTAWRPVFLHPPAAEVQLLRDAVAKLSTIVRVPNAEHIADEHNAAVAFLRRALEGGE